jgi:hypothetical protein
VQIAITSKNASVRAVEISGPTHGVPNLRRSLALNAQTMGTWSRGASFPKLGRRLQFDSACRLLGLSCYAASFGQFAESESQKGNNCRFLSAHAFDFLGHVDAGLCRQRREQRAIEETLENRRVDVTSPADRVYFQDV